MSKRISGLARLKRVAGCIDCGHSTRCKELADNIVLDGNEITLSEASTDIVVDCLSSQLSNVPYGHISGL